MSPVFAQTISDKTGLKTTFDVVTEGGTFVVESVANFDIQRFSFEGGKLVFDINSSIENNFAEFQIPKNITKGDLHFYVDGQEIDAKVLQNDKISFTTLEFSGVGEHILEITSDYVPTITEQLTPVLTPTKEKPDQLTIIVAVVGIVVAVGVGSMIAVYLKRKNQ